MFSLYITYLVLTEDELKNLTLVEIEKLLRRRNKSLKKIETMPQVKMPLNPESYNQLISHKLNYNHCDLILEHKKLTSTMTEEQRSIYDTIMSSVDANSGGFFFIDGYGGTGKTFIWKVISAEIRSRGEIVLTIASSGIAALLIPGGKTVHFRFGMPIQIFENSTCPIKPEDPLAQLIVESKLIIWDEALKLHRHCFEAVDKTFRDIFRVSNPRSADIPFGGKVIVLGGDFRKILPVIPRAPRHDVVDANINSSRLWKHCRVLKLTKNMRLQTGSSCSDVNELKEFSDWILNVGDGNIGDNNDGEAEIEIPDDMLIKNSGDPISSIVNSTYPSLLENMSDISFFQDRAILEPTNDIVDSLNNYILSMTPGEKRTYLSIDSPSTQDENINGPDQIRTPEFFNTVKSSCLPNHELNLKVRVPIMLLRNIDQLLGLRNGTRLIITQMGNFVLEAKIIS
jgi:hypothetical protein